MKTGLVCEWHPDKSWPDECNCGAGMRKEDVMAERGRPTDYKPEYAEQAAKLCALGATDFELADFFRVNTATIYRWRNVHADFCEAVTCGKEKADERVARALYNRAVGYTFESEKIQVMRDGSIVRAPMLEHVAPDPAAAMNWLKNRQPDKWRDKQDHEVKHDVSDPMKEFMERIASNGKRIHGDG